MHTNGIHPTLLIGIDVGGTKIAVLVADDSGQVRARAASPTTLDGPQSTLSAIVETARHAVDLAGGDMRDVAAVGVGVPGRVDPVTGLVRRAVNLGWRELAVGEILSERLGVPCFLENDVRTAALGAQRYLGGAARNMAYVSIGTGIAAGLVLNGRIYRGAHGLAGEIGHMVVELDGPLCACGARGCLEVLASGPAIARMAEEAALSTRDTSLRAQETYAAEVVYRAAAGGDALAQSVVQRAARYLALALQQLTVTYDVERIVLGGGVARNAEAFLRPVLRGFERLRQGSVLATETMQPDMIGLLPPEYDPATWGAVALAARNIGPANHIETVKSNA